MKHLRMKHLSLAFLAQALFFTAMPVAQEQPGKNPYASMAPLDQYLIPDKDTEIGLARSAAPASISNEAEVMVLGRDGYTSVVKGTNGFLCIVERSWGAATDDPEFWNAKVRSPICFNLAAARSFARIYLMKSKLVLAGKSKTEIVRTIDSAFESGELPALELGAMSYMMSEHQYLNDRGKSWHPHLMFFVPGDAAKSWGADLEGSPVMAANDPEERATISHGLGWQLVRRRASAADCALTKTRSLLSNEATFWAPSAFRDKPKSRIHPAGSMERAGGALSSSSRFRGTICDWTGMQSLRTRPAFH